MLVVALSLFLLLSGVVADDEPICWSSGLCAAQALDRITAVMSRYQCLKFCKEDSKCTYVSYSPETYECLLLPSCPTLDSAQEYVSGEVDCPIMAPTGSEWHMTIGGKSGNEALATVELFNWANGTQCRLADLPETMVKPVGAVLDGVPFVCGTNCYQYSRTKKNWLKSNPVLKAVADGSSVVVPDHGWAVFGGNDRTSAQQLMAANARWQNGPALFEGRAVNSHCALQINEYETAFFGGNLYSDSVIVYDWRNGTYTKMGITLNAARVGSACSLMKDKNGRIKAAIIGGSNKGMELWNPVDGTIEIAFNKLPHENGSILGLAYSTVLPIKGGDELLMYGGWKGSHHKGIWRYTVADNTWVRIGSLVTARGEHVTLEVDGITCP